MEHPAVVSRRKLQRVYTVMRGPTRAKLKVIAGLQGITLFELLDTLAADYIKGWQKLHKLDVDKLLAGSRSPATSGKKSKRKKV